MSGPKFGQAAEAVRSGLVKTRTQFTDNIIRRKDRFMALPLVSTLDVNLRYMVSQDNIDNMRDRYHYTYHWIAGTEVTEIQEKARYLEGKLNHHRKEMRESREALDGVVERLRDITTDLEHTGRGDVKHLHLRQLEYETIQEEMKLSKVVQKNQFQERETFTMLMNAVKEAHETERNYNQRMKMISLGGAILGSCVGYLFSARLNSVRFSRMDETINKKLELLSFTTINAIREIHGLEPTVISEPEKRGLLTRLWGLYRVLEALMVRCYHLAVQGAGELVEVLREAMKKQPELEDNGGSSTTSNTSTTTVVPMSDSFTQTPGPMMVKVVEVPSKVNYSELPEFQALVRSLTRIEKQQESLKKLMLTEREQIAVSVSTSDDEIIAMLQSDQQSVRHLLNTIQGTLEGGKSDIGVNLSALGSTIDSLSLKLSNASELYVGGLEHSKIINDMAGGLEDVKSHLDRLETHVADGLNGQVRALEEASGSVGEELSALQDEVIRCGEKSAVRDSEMVQRLEEILSGIIASVEELKDPTAMERLAAQLDAAVSGVRDVRDAVEELRSEGAGIVGEVEKLKDVTDSGLSVQTSALDRLAETVGEMKTVQGEHFTSLNETVSLLEQAQQAVMDRPEMIAVIPPPPCAADPAGITLPDLELPLSKIDLAADKVTQTPETLIVQEIIPNLPSSQPLPPGQYLVRVESIVRKDQETSEAVEKEDVLEMLSTPEIEDISSSSDEMVGEVSRSSAATGYLYASFVVIYTAALVMYS